MNFITIKDDMKPVISYLDYAGSNILMPWANGKFGVFVDHLGDDVFRFVDYYFNPGAKNIEDRIRKIHLTEEDELACPIVASGIVVYWIKKRNENKSITEIFDEYYKMKENRYIKENEKCFNAWKRKLNIEFKEKYLEQEQKLIKISERIYPYLNSEDIVLIKQLTENYLEYVQTQAYKTNNETADPIKEETKIIVDSVYDKQTETLYLQPLNTKGKGKKSGKKRTGRPNAKPFEEYLRRDAPESFMQVLVEMMEGKTGKDAALIIRACIGYWIDEPENKSVVNRFPSVKSTSYNTAMSNPSLFTDDEIKEIRSKINEILKNNNT